ncbi:type II toxin-antitoxin system HicB family antitoxin [Turicimonas muris]|uniref:type II toxin-antitoxin system HicB family antitoxin n=1 Tax=Turicimonas muris TaxID=1796652 RepID=UPI0026DF3934|nr:hypothetical protein [Turicimonas muris]
MARYQYPMTVESNGEGGFIACFRDVPEAVTESWSLDELKEDALDALITAIDLRTEENSPPLLSCKPEIWLLIYLRL